MKDIIRKEQQNIRLKKSKIEQKIYQLIPLQKKIYSFVEQMDIASINQLKQCRSLTSIIKAELEGISILYQLQISPIRYYQKIPLSRNIEIPYHSFSYDESGRYIMGPRFDLRNIKDLQIHKINGETIQLLQPLLLHGSFWNSQQMMRLIGQQLNYYYFSMKIPEKIRAYLYAVYNYCLKYLPIQKQKESLDRQQSELMMKLQLIEQQEQNNRLIQL